MLTSRRRRGEITALVVDEAQSLSLELLEEIRLLANIETDTEKLLPLALSVIGHDRRDAAAVAVLRRWVRDGAHRVDRSRTGHYGDQAAIALFDTWWDDKGKGNGGLAKDTLSELASMMTGSKVSAGSFQIECRPVLAAAAAKTGSSSGAKNRIAAVRRSASRGNQESRTASHDGCINSSTMISATLA